MLFWPRWLTSGIFERQEWYFWEARGYFREARVIFSRGKKQIYICAKFLVDTSQPFLSRHSVRQRQAALELNLIIPQNPALRLFTHTLLSHKHKRRRRIFWNYFLTAWLYNVCHFYASDFMVRRVCWKVYVIYFFFSSKEFELRTKEREGLEGD